MKQYIDIPNTNNQKLELSIYYSLGGMNYFTYKQEARGYYGSITPVTFSDNCMSFTAFSGVKAFLLEVKRRNQTQYTEACKIFETKKQALIEHVLAKLSNTNDLEQISKELGYHFPPGLAGKSRSDIENMPVLICEMSHTTNFNSLLEAKEYLTSKKLVGPFLDSNKLRFEDSETYEILSR